MPLMRSPPSNGSLGGARTHPGRRSSPSYSSGRPDSPKKDESAQQGFLPTVRTSKNLANSLLYQAQVPQQQGVLFMLMQQVQPPIIIVIMASQQH